MQFTNWENDTMIRLLEEHKKNDQNAIRSACIEIAPEKLDEVLEGIETKFNALIQKIIDEDKKQ